MPQNILHVLQNALPVSTHMNSHLPRYWWGIIYEIFSKNTSWKNGKEDTVLSVGCVIDLPYFREALTAFNISSGPVLPLHVIFL